MRANHPWAIGACAVAVMVLGLRGWTTGSRAQAVAAGQPGSQRTPAPMTLVDLINVPRMTDAQLSPDGRSVSYNLARNDWKANRQVPQIWKQSVAGGPPVPLTSGAPSSSARWSPDGRSLLFLSGGQIHVVSADGGTPRQLTKHVTSVNASVAPMRMPTWSPDGATIYFVAADPRPASDTTSASYVTTVGQRNTPLHLWKISSATGAETRITSGDWSVLGYRLSRDGRRVAMLRAPSADEGDHYRSEVWVMDADGGNARAVTSNGLYELDAELSPDNARVWFLVDAAPVNDTLEPYHGHAVFTVPATGGAPRMVAPRLGHSIDQAAWAPDGRSILAVVNLGVSQQIYRIDATSGTATALTNGQHAIPFWTLVPAANRMIFQLDEPTRLGDAWTLAAEGGTPVRVTGIYDSLTTDFAWPRQERVTWKGADGVAIEGLLFYPIGYQAGRRYPLVVQLHGGPADSDKFGLGPGVIFNYVPVLAARGYAVLRPNYRGSSGYGSAFVRDIVGHYFNNMHLDVLAGVDALVAQGIADPARLAVTGASAGGHLVNKLITFTDRFKFASSTAGVGNWISMMAQTDAVTRRTFWTGGTPWQKDAPTDRLWADSPIRDVARVKTPTLFIVGELDERVPLAQVLEMYRGLDANNVPTRLIVGKGEGHTWVLPQTTFAKDNIELEWLEKYVMGRTYKPESAPGN